jgi:hypothetical protein
MRFNGLVFPSDWAFAAVALPVLGGNPDYLRWIGESLE